MKLELQCIFWYLISLLSKTSDWDFKFIIVIIKRLKVDEQADKIHLWKEKLHHSDKSALKFAYGLLFADCQCFCSSSTSFVPKSPRDAKTPASCSYAMFMSYFLRICIDCCFCFVIFTRIINSSMSLPPCLFQVSTKYYAFDDFFWIGWPGMGPDRPGGYLRTVLK